MAEVEVIKAVEGPVLRKRDYEGNPLVIKRQRVAAYVRVSTDDEEQLESFQSQKQYYQDKISENRDWVMVGIYADEAMTGTKVDKREGFQRMIQDCLDGKIDVIMTKSVSRFSRNTVDILQHVRLLRNRGIAVIFEKENINTMTEQGEMLLTLMGTLAQNEVESTSKNVKMGIKMKMKRGELMGFNGCLGYDYHPEDKTLTVNEAEAETVRLIFELYLQGYGTYTIARRLTELGKINKKGEVKWTDSGIRGIIKNEKYKGDLLLQKTITTDPLTKRRIENFGEEEQYYVRDHHEPIVTKEVWEKAKEIRMSRNRQSEKKADGKREKYTKKYALSSMCECGFCGTKLTRRTLHSSSKYETPVWYCRSAANKGKETCPNSKSVHESILENAFLEACRLLAGSFDDVIDSVVDTIESISTNNDDITRLKKEQKSLDNYEQRRKKLTDLYLDDGISKEAYDEKYEELSLKIQKSKESIEILQGNVSSQKDVGKRMEALKKALADGDILDEFDRVVFESIVDKVIVGEAYDDGTVDPFKLTFVMKGNGSRSIPDAKEWFKAEKSTIQSA
ncbi:MAG: recombinase family protein [Lachnospiraceae bacterium]|nr:recombinase family protein [Lachnospiraceae bacterium]